MSKTDNRKAWSWIPSLYFAEGIPYVVVMTVSVIMYKRMGISNTDIALYTSWLYLPWVIKPLWSPLVDLVKTKRWWIVTMQLVIGAGLGGVALTMPLPGFFTYSLAFLWLLAFSSATHDIAADGFYMLGLSTHQQAWFVGVRSTFYRIAMITGQGLLIILAGYIESHSGLNTIEFQVSTQPGKEIHYWQHPDSLHLPKSGVFELQISDESIELSTATIKKIEADSTLTFVKNWNHDNGFELDETRKNEIINNDGTLAKPEEPSLWERVIVTPLEQLITSLFGEEIIQTDRNSAGNIALAYIYLGAEPKNDEPIVLNLGRDIGDNSISLVRGLRLVFNKDNWDKPAIAAIQIDPKLKTISSAGFKGTSGNIPLSWSITFSILCGSFIAFFLYHKFILPYPQTDKPVSSNGTSIMGDFFNTFTLFFKREKIGIILGFLLLFRFGEAQLVKLASPFLLDAQEVGGLALTTGEVGFVYGTIGILFLTLGGIIGGIVASKHGLKKWLWPMVFAINLPNLAYVYLSTYLPESFFLINTAIAIEQFGYGFGFTAYMLYMIYISQGDHKTAHYAICTGFMALGMMIPGMFSGWIQSLIGYEKFFWWVVIATIPAFIITKYIPLDPEFGKKIAEDV